MKQEAMLTVLAQHEGRAQGRESKIILCLPKVRKQEVQVYSLRLCHSLMHSWSSRHWNSKPLA